MAGARRRSRLVTGFGLAAIAAAVALAALGVTPLDRLSPLVFDAYQRLQPRAEAGAPVTVVDIDEASIRRLGQWPWPRDTLAAMVDRLTELGAAAIAFDMVFPEPDRSSLARVAGELERAGATVVLPADRTALDNDLMLAEAFARGSVVAGIAISGETASTLPAPRAGFAFGGADPKSYLPDFRGGVSNLAPLTEAARGFGFFSFPPTHDGVVRSIPLVASAQGSLYPALSLETLRVAQGASSILVRSTGASGEADTGAPAMVAVRTGALEIPTGPGGELWIYHSGLPSMPVVPAARLLDPAAGAELAAAVEGRIVLIGTSAVGLRDLVVTPLQQGVAGVRVHAEAIDQVMAGVALSRPDWAFGAEIVAAILLGGVLILLARRAGAVACTLGALVLVAAAVGLSWGAFSGGLLLIDPLLPAGTVTAVFVVSMPLLLLLTDREKQQVRDAFGHYLAPALVERLADDPRALRLGGETRELTVLFSDIRGFTALSETLDPDELTALLNGFLTPMTEVLLSSEATIDKYMGDAVMAFWNAPLDIAGHPRKACLAALAMLEALDRLNAGRAAPLAIGIGLHTGPACVGNLGSAQRFSYSAIGDGVNLASRVEGLTKTYGVAVLVTEATRTAAGDLAFLEVDRVRVVGRDRAVTVFALLGDAAHAASDAFRDVATRHARYLAAWRAGDRDTARITLADARRTAPPALARLYAAYAARIDLMPAGPAPADWDGTIDARTK